MPTSTADPAFPRTTDPHRFLRDPYPGGMSIPSAAEPRDPKAALVFDDPLDRQSSDDTDRGWGESATTTGDAAADLKRFLDEKPPHHI